MRLFKPAMAFAASAFLLAACGDGANSNGTYSANTAASRPASNSGTQGNAAQPSPTPDEFAAVRAVYAQECLRCHQAEGQGGVFEEPGLKPLKVPSLREGHALGHTDAQLARQITNGGEGMPAFKARLKPEQITQLVAFIRKEFQGQTASTGSPGAPQSAPAPAMSAH